VELRGLEPLTPCLRSTSGLSETVAHLGVGGFWCRSQTVSVGLRCGQEWWSGFCLANRNAVKLRLTPCTVQMRATHSARHRRCHAVRHSTAGARILLTVRVAFPEPPLAGARIVLRCPDTDDVPWITLACSDRELSRYVPGIPYPYSESDARAFIEHVGQGWADGTGAVFVIADAATDDGWGTIGLHLHPVDAELAEVGYWLRREARGQGAATTAVRLVSGWAFAELGVRRLNLSTAPENAASQRVAERAGFTREGLLRAWLPTAAGRRDTVMYSLLPDDPPAKPPTF
jgi:RimJ/RimL family protein N-acetyltransferase